jgi:LysR family nitrogen assimilation transcriptional regulator
MDLTQLRYFLRVAELGSFTRASLDLGIAQPALSRQLRLLEVELGQHLLIRNGRGATPTEAGKLLMEHARGILHQVDRAREALGSLRGTPAGKVGLGLPTSLALRWAVPFTRAFRQELPEATLSIKEGLSDGLMQSLVNGRLDIALLYNAPTHADIDNDPLFDEELVVVQRREELEQTGVTQAVSLKELAQLPLIIPSQPNAIRMQVDAALSAKGLKPTIALEIDGVSAILELVADGAGCAVLARPGLQSASRPERFAQRPVEGHQLQARLSLATSRRRPATLAQKRTVALLRDLLIPGKHAVSTTSR